MSMEAYSERYEDALALAASAHQDQTRKAGGEPYVVHVVHVSVILLRHGFSEDVAIAGLLHDVVEDQDVPLAEIEAGFGPAVAEMVAALTERKLEDGQERPWGDRKREALAHLEGTSREAAAVKAADTLHNARSLALALRRDGPSIWRRFKRGPAETLWYYRRVADLVRQRLGPHPLAEDLEVAIAALERVPGHTAGVVGTLSPRAGQ
jgi:(p)ppGpp synthase/HD superfamily hydrolase